MDLQQCASGPGMVTPRAIGDINAPPPQRIPPKPVANAKVENPYKRKIVKKDYIPTERTSTMSFKAPVTKAKQQEILNAKKPEKTSSGALYGAVGMITAPVRFLTSAFTGSKPEKPEIKQTKISKEGLKPIARSPSLPRHKMRKSLNASFIPVNTRVTASESKRKVSPASKSEGRPRSPSPTTNADAPTAATEGYPKQKIYIIPGHTKHTKQSIEAVKTKALNNLKQAIQTRIDKEKAKEDLVNPTPVRSRSPSPAPMVEVKKKPTKQIHNIKVNSTKKYAYKITSDIKEPEPRNNIDLPVEKEVKRRNLPVPIRVTSGRGYSAEQTIKVNPKTAARSRPRNRASAWSSPRFQYADNQSNTFETEQTYENACEADDFNLIRSNKEFEPTLMPGIASRTASNSSSRNPNAFNFPNEDEANFSNSASCAVFPSNGINNEAQVDFLLFSSPSFLPWNETEFNSSNNAESTDNGWAQKALGPSITYPDRSDVDEQKSPRTHAVPVLTPNVPRGGVPRKPKPFLNKPPDKKITLGKPLPELQASPERSMEKKQRITPKAPRSSPPNMRRTTPPHKEIVYQPKSDVYKGAKNPLSYPVLKNSTKSNKARVNVYREKNLKSNQFRVDVKDEEKLSKYKNIVRMTSVPSPDNRVDINDENKLSKYKNIVKMPSIPVLDNIKKIIAPPTKPNAEINQKPNVIEKEKEKVKEIAKSEERADDQSNAKPQIEKQGAEPKTSNVPTTPQQESDSILPATNAIDKDKIIPPTLIPNAKSEFPFPIPKIPRMMPKTEPLVISAPKGKEEDTKYKNTLPKHSKDYPILIHVSPDRRLKSSTSQSVPQIGAGQPINGSKSKSVPQISAGSTVPPTQPAAGSEQQTKPVKAISSETDVKAKWSSKVLPLTAKAFHSIASVMTSTADSVSSAVSTTADSVSSAVSSTADTMYTKATTELKKLATKEDGNQEQQSDVLHSKYLTKNYPPMKKKKVVPVHQEKAKPAAPPFHPVRHACETTRMGELP